MSDTDLGVVPYDSRQLAAGTPFLSKVPVSSGDIVSRVTLCQRHYAVNASAMNTCYVAAELGEQAAVPCTLKTKPVSQCIPKPESVMLFFDSEAMPTDTAQLIQHSERRHRPKLL